jgi:hypothetical protein
MEYEFDMVLDLGMDHNANVSKTRIKAFDQRIFTPNEKTGKELLAWLNEGTMPEPVSVPLAVHKEVAPSHNANGQRLITEPQRKRLFALLKTSDKTPDQLKEFLFETLGTDHTTDIPMDDYEQVCNWITGAL